MFLAIDIGNTTTTFGVFDGENIIEKLIKPTIRNQTTDEIKDVVEDLFDLPVREILVSSVVPQLDESYEKLAADHFHANIDFIDHTFDLGFTINYEQKENLGADRLVAAFAAVEKYGKPCVVCDLGTATTIDAVNSENEYLGGVIVPGIKTFADSLHQKAAKLPKVEVVKTASVFGKTSAGSIQSGIYFGYLGLIEKIIGQMVTELDEDAKIIATGGFSAFIGENCDLIEIVDADLMLDGLRLIYEKTFADKK